MPKQTKQSSKTLKQTFAVITAALSVAFLVLAGLAWWGGTYATNMVRDELTAQKIFFPEAGSPGFSAEEYPDLQKYAGKQVNDYATAKAYANGYIGRHLENTADGKTYAEVSTLARQNPDNQELQAQRQSLFMGETLRGVLLSSGFAFGLIGTIALIAAWVLFALAAVSALAAFVLMKK